MEKEALEKITVALEAGASSNTTCQRTTRDYMGTCMLISIILRVCRLPHAAASLCAHASTVQGPWGCQGCIYRICRSDATRILGYIVYIQPWQPQGSCSVHTCACWLAAVYAVHGTKRQDPHGYWVGG